MFTRMRYRHARLVYDNCVDGTGSLLVTHCDVAPDTTCCCWVTPTGTRSAKFLSESSAGSSSFTPLSSIRGSWKRCAPDLVVTMLAERFLIAVPGRSNGAHVARARGPQAGAERDRAARAPLDVAAAPVPVAPSNDAGADAGGGKLEGCGPGIAARLCGAATRGARAAAVVGDRAPTRSSSHRHGRNRTAAVRAAFRCSRRVAEDLEAWRPSVEAAARGSSSGTRAARGRHLGGMARSYLRAARPRGQARRHVTREPRGRLLAAAHQCGHRRGTGE